MLYMHVHGENLSIKCSLPSLTSPRLTHTAVGKTPCQRTGRNPLSQDDHRITMIFKITELNWNFI